MKAKRYLAVLGLIVFGCSALTPAANAFYNPQPGRWLTRDPIGEPGFGVASEIKRNTNQHMLNHAFVENSPIGYWDYLGLDNPGCDTGVAFFPGFTLCNLRCCARHDTYYFNHNPHCTSASWLLIWNPCSRCGRCNRQVVGCLLGCALGGEGPDVDPYFCPNGPHQGTPYKTWDEIPLDCWEHGMEPGFERPPLPAPDAP